MAFSPEEAVEFLRLVDDAESDNRIKALEDLRFSHGDQWLAADVQSRQLQGRPRLTINKMDAYIRQVTNGQRQQRPRIKVHPMDGVADKKIAEILTGIIRHIEVNSNADNAYDLAFDYACRMGWGFFRLNTRYVRDDSFDQDIFVDQVENPFTVYFDPNSTLPDGSDAEECLIADLMRKTAFKKEYPGAQDSGFNANAMGDDTLDWVTEHDIRVAEYFKIEQERDKLVMLSSGETVYASQMPTPDLMTRFGLRVVGDRPSWRKKVMWRKVTASEVLEERELIGRYIPVFPVYGNVAIREGKRVRYGMVRNGRDPQMLYNFERTAVIESLAMFPKAKWLMAEGQDEGHENEWAQANVANYPVLRYKTRDAEGNQISAPIRIQPEPPPEGFIVGSELSNNDLQAVMGMFDPAMGKPSGPKSGTAIRAEQGQSEQSNYQYFDNFTRTLRHMGRVVLDYTPKIYDKQRVMRIIGDDGKPDLVTINGQMVDETGAAIDKIENDVTVGEYDVYMDTGPSFNSKRAEERDTFALLMNGPLGEEIAKVGGDLVVRTYDSPGMDVLADRLAAANPLSQVDEKSDVPPQAQMQIKSLQQNVQQLQQALQQAEQEIKLKTGINTQNNETRLRIAHMQEVNKAHSDQVWSQEEREQVQSVERTKRHDTETRAITAQNVEELRGLVKILESHVSGAQAEKAFDRQSEQADRQMESVAQ